MNPSFILCLCLLLPAFSQAQEINVKKIEAEAFKSYKHASDKPLIVVKTGLQKLFLVRNGGIERTYEVSTGRSGESSLMGSRGTPLGWHHIRMKVGDGEPAGRWIYYKKATNVLIPIHTDQTRSDGDYLITRVMALAGLEEGRNRGGPEGIYDSFKRGINIHGTPEEGLIGTKASHGCVRMRNREIIELYDLVPLNTLVYIMQ